MYIEYAAKLAHAHVSDARRRKLFPPGLSEREFVVSWARRRPGGASNVPVHQGNRRQRPSQPGLISKTS